MDRSPPESSRHEGFFRCRDAGETLSRMKIRSSLILGVALQFGSITFAQDHKIEVTGDYSCIHANPQNNNLIPSFSLDGPGGSAVETPERRELAKVLACLLRGHGHHRPFQAVADCLSHFSKRHFLFGDRTMAAPAEAFSSTIL